MLSKLSLLSVKEVLVYCMLFRVKVGSTVYKEGDDANGTSYIVLFGKILLYNMKLGLIGSASTGDAFGEEGILDKREVLTTKLDDVKPTFLIRREEMATAEEESFVLEFTTASFEKLKERLFSLHL